MLSETFNQIKMLYDVLLLLMYPKICYAEFDKSHIRDLKNLVYQFWGFQNDPIKYNILVYISSALTYVYVKLKKLILNGF